MMLPARRFRPALLCFALLCACGAASATDGRHMAADGSGSCPEGDTAAATPADRAEDAEVEAGGRAARHRHPPSGAALAQLPARDVPLSDASGASARLSQP